MRIALFTEVFLPKIDGITNRLRHTLPCLEAEGHECLLFAPDTALPALAALLLRRLPETAPRPRNARRRVPTEPPARTAGGPAPA